MHTRRYVVAMAAGLVLPGMVTVAEAAGPVRPAAGTYIAASDGRPGDGFGVCLGRRR